MSTVRCAAHSSILSKNQFHINGKTFQYPCVAPLLSLSLSLSSLSCNAVAGYLDVLGNTALDCVRGNCGMLLDHLAC